jgi:hypothetical protein
MEFYEPIDGPAMAQADQAVMRRYFTDPNLFVMENERLHAAIAVLRRRYDAEIKLLKPAIADLLKDRKNTFTTDNLPEMLPRFLIRISNNSQSSLTLGLNFIRTTVDAITNHVQHKVAHFHHALLVLGGVMDEHLRRFHARLTGLDTRVKGVECALGISATEATAMAGAKRTTEATLYQRVADLEVSLQSLRSELVLVKLKRMSSEVREEAARSRATSPSCRSESSMHSRTSHLSSSSTQREARSNLARAKSTGSTQAMIAAAQRLAHFRLSDGSFGSEDEW